MANSTGLKQELGDRASEALFARHHTLVRKTLAEFAEGREIETAGDSFLLVFSTPSAAVQFGLVLQSRLRGLRLETGIAVADRIGIHLGEVVIREEEEPGAQPLDLYGIQIDVCSRVMSLARAGQILMTQAVFDSSRQLLKGEDLGEPLDWLQYGRYELQGLKESVEICEVRTAGVETGGAPTSSDKARRQVAAGEEEVLGWRPAIGQTVPETRWVLEGQLGAGGFGEVWLGRHPSTKETRVFKFCFQAERARYLKRELTLFRLLKERVGNHRNIVRLHDVSIERPPFYVELDYVEGRDLRTWCESQGGIDRISLETRLEIVIQVADALQAACEAGIIHRDVKPANILIASSPPGGQDRPIEVKLTDFGIGQVLSEEYLNGITRAGFTQTSITPTSSSHTGTQLYMAPELLAGQPATTRSDIYSLGVVLYQLLAGSFSLPVTSDWAERIEDPLLRADLKGWLAGDPERRPVRFGEVAASLRNYPQRRLKFDAQNLRFRALMLGRRVAWAVLVLALAGTAAWFYFHNASVRRARQSVLPEVARLADNGENGLAFDLAMRVESVLRGDSALSNLLDRISVQTSVDSQPAGAEVQIKPYLHPEQPWRILGRTPLPNHRIPKGIYRWRISKDGCDTIEHALETPRGHVAFHLDARGTLPPGMIMVSGGEVDLTEVGTTSKYRVEDFLIDRFEVTNREFKKFVDSGAYQNTNFWPFAFLKMGRPLPWAEAMARFRDRSGQPGPSTWTGGEYPPDRGDFPVTGVSWYEAAAYALFAGKELPTVFHWDRAGRGTKETDWLSVEPAVVRMSNFDAQGAAPAGRYQGMSPSGAFDMAGNAREWCWNESTDATRTQMGGGWGDPGYLFYYVDTSDPFDRGANRGFRCMKQLSGPRTPALFDSVEPITRRDYQQESPCSPETFEVYQQFYDYQKTPLDAVVEPAPDGSQDWRRERVTFQAADGTVRIPAYLFLPASARPPFQTLIVFPHGGARTLKSSATSLESMFEIAALLRSGRAVCHPIYDGTYERFRSWDGFTESRARESIIGIVKEFRRAVDYLQTRVDIDHNKLGYFGASLGAWQAPRFLAVEDRVRIGILLLGGLPLWKQPAGTDPLDFAPRVKIPILMLNGRYDSLFPVEISQVPLFQTLGTAPEHKRHVILEGGHEYLGLATHTEMLAWLDKYFGPAK